MIVTLFWEDSAFDKGTGAEQAGRRLGLSFALSSSIVKVQFLDKTT